MPEFHMDSHAHAVLPGRPVLVGVPLDLTVIKRSGCADGPRSIRRNSWFVQPYSYALNADLKECSFADIGDVDLAGRSLEDALERIRETTTSLLKQECRPLCIGGEHTITLPIVQAFSAVNPNFHVVHVDAHADLCDEFEGSRLNRATVMRRISEIIGPERLIQVGVRDGTREEYEWMKEKQTLLNWSRGGGQCQKILLDRIQDRPCYLTLDLDVLDPSCLPGTGYPVPGGWTYQELEHFLHSLARSTTRGGLLGADVVELNPGLDASNTSTITAAYVIREILLILGRNHDT